MRVVSIRSIRKLSCWLGVCAAIMLAFGFFGRVAGFDVADSSRTVPLKEAWSAGWVQGWMGLQMLLAVCAAGLWHMQQWARWIAYFWFPMLGLNNMAVEFFQTWHFPLESFAQALPITAVWLYGLYSPLMSKQAAEVFREANRRIVSK